MEKDYDHIVGHIFLGNMFSSYDRTLMSIHVNHVICLLENIDTQHPFCYNNDKITTLHLPIADHVKADIIPVCEKAYEYLDNARSKGNNVLVFCMAGRSRSAAVIVYYLMKRYKMAYEEAYDFVERRRSQIHINLGFQNQLSPQKHLCNRVILLNHL